MGHEPTGIFERGDPIPEADARIAVSVVTSPYVTIERSLAARGCVDVVPFYDLAESLRGQHPLANGWFAEPLAAADQRQIEGVLAGWDDDVSRAHHLQFIACAGCAKNGRLRVPRSRPSATSSPNSRRRCTTARPSSTAALIMAPCRSRSAAMVAGPRIVVVEPDSGNRAVLGERLRGLSQTAVLDCALAAQDGIAAFSEGYGYASKLSAFGQRKSAPARSTASMSSRHSSSCISRVASSTLYGAPARPCMRIGQS